MNLLLKMTLGHTLLYMEDDWLALDHVSEHMCWTKLRGVLRAAHEEDPSSRFVK